MPDRMIREGLVHSPRVNALSERAACAFFFLLLKVDDFGVFFAEPKLVRGAIWPMKSIRDAEVSRVLDEIERAGLLARFTALDGLRYLCLLRFRQKLAYGHRRRYPKPPFDEDTGELRLELMGEPPPPVVSPKKRKEEKRRESVREAPAALPAPIIDQPCPESHEAWLARLQVAWPHLDVRAEAVKAYLKKTKRGEQLERGWFEANWLKNCTETVTNKALFASKAAVGAAQGEPEGWRDVLEGTVLGDAVEAGEIGGWDDLNKTQRDFVHQRLVEMRRAAS